MKTLCTFNPDVILVRKSDEHTHINLVRRIAKHLNLVVILDDTNDEESDWLFLYGIGCDCAKKKYSKLYAKWAKQQQPVI